MKQTPYKIGSIPAIVWGEPSEKAYLYVHGKLSNKESAEAFAALAEERGFQTVSFDLPGHGERSGEDRSCGLFQAVEDLTAVGGWVFRRWASVSLYGCSIGAFFSLHAYRDRAFSNCLFQSPIVDMEYLTGRMFQWFGVTEEMLRERGEIPTPVETLSWPYYQYVKTHPIRAWNSPTQILYGGRDTLQSREVLEDFSRRFHARLTVSEQSDHPFLEPDDGPVVTAWLRESIR